MATGWAVARLAVVAVLLRIAFGATAPVEESFREQLIAMASISDVMEGFEDGLIGTGIGDEDEDEDEDEREQGAAARLAERSGGSVGGGVGGEDERDTMSLAAAGTVAGRVSGGIPRMDATDDDVMRVAAATAMARGAKDGGKSAREARGISRGVERLAEGATHPYESDLIVAAARRHARRNGHVTRRGSNPIMSDTMFGEDEDELGAEAQTQEDSGSVGWEDRAEAFQRRAQQAFRDASGPWKWRWTQEEPEVTLSQLGPGQAEWEHPSHNEI